MVSTRRNKVDDVNSWPKRGNLFFFKSGGYVLEVPSECALSFLMPSLLKSYTQNFIIII